MSPYAQTLNDMARDFVTAYKLTSFRTHPDPVLFRYLKVLVVVSQ